MSAIVDLTIYQERKRRSDSIVRIARMINQQRAEKRAAIRQGIVAPYSSPAVEADDVLNLLNDQEPPRLATIHPIRKRPLA